MDTDWPSCPQEALQVFLSFRDEADLIACNALMAIFDRVEQWQLAEELFVELNDAQPRGNRSRIQSLSGLYLGISVDGCRRYSHFTSWTVQRVDSGRRKSSCETAS